MTEATRTASLGVWIKTSARLPRTRDQHFSPVLFVRRGAGNTVCAGRYYQRLRQFTSLQGVTFSVQDVTHWAHMPKPPKAPTKKRRART